MLLEMRSVNKSFFDTHALSDICLTLDKGEVRALIGPNGSGKSTVARILSGDIRQDTGSIFFDGNLLNNDLPAETLRAGIFALYQEHYLIPNMSVADNLFMCGYLKKFGIFVNHREIRRRTREILKKFNSNLSPDIKVCKLSQGEQYVISAAKAFVQKAKLFVLDEPTAGLAKEERKVLYHLIRCLKANGAAVLYITHRMSELREICDSVTIMRDGKIVLTSSLKDISQSRILQLMEVGECMTEVLQEDKKNNTEVLSVRNLCLNHAYKDINLTLNKGETLGIIGTNGSGRTAFLKTLFGAIKQDSGEIYINGKNAENLTIRKAIKEYKIGYLPDDRLHLGIIPDLTLIENTMLTNRETTKSFFVRKSDEMDRFIDCILEKGFFLADPMKPIKYLSGGSQQKALFYRWIASDAKIILLDEPTKGIDIASKNEMYSTILECAAQGISFIICSSDREELEPVCTNIISIKKGRLNTLL
ncbi:MAG: sugar ABC transporter ATP-binding protein [Lachnospiraceae bacterium]|nr:sugar ABC transporter ATP-binding protein [Lachnospiraceae bacterium]